VLPSKRSFEGPILVIPAILPIPVQTRGEQKFPSTDQNHLLSNTFIIGFLNKNHLLVNINPVLWESLEKPTSTES
jgi:hypothetical protein